VLVANNKANQIISSVIPQNFRREQNYTGKCKTL